MVDISPRDLDSTVRTVAAEAGNQPAEGQQAVAHVILNRAGANGQSLHDVVSAPGQFEGWDNGNSTKISPKSALYKTTYNNIKPVLIGQVEDNTSGATHFYSPKSQAALGRPAPAWAQGEGIKIGDHVFYNVASNSPQLPHSTQLDKAFGLPEGSGSTGSQTTAAPTQNNTQLPPQASLDKAFGVDRAAAPIPSPNQAQQTPGYQKVYKQFSAPAATKDMLGHPISYPSGRENALMGSLAQGYTLNTLPVLTGAAAAIGAGVNNFLHDKLGIGKNSGYNVDEAYNGARQAAYDNLNNTAQKYPVTSAIGNTAGFVASPATLALSAATAPARAALVAKGGLKAFAGRAALGTAEGALTGGAAGAGEGVSQGGSASDVAKNAVAYGIPSALGGAAGETLVPAGAKVAAALVGKDAHPAVATAARVGAHALGSGAVGAALGAAYGGEKGAVAGAITGGAFGSAGGVREGAPVRNYSQEAHDAAVEHLASTVAPNLEDAAKHFEAANPVHTTAEATGEHAVPLMDLATQENADSVGNLRGAVADRQNQSNVKTNLTTNANSAIGGDISEAGVNSEKQIAQERATNQVAAQPENLAVKAVDDIHSATGVNPESANVDYGDYVRNKKETVDRPLWEKVENANPVTTDEHSKLLAEEPIVAQTIAQVQKTLGPEATAPNLNFKQAENPKTPNDLTPEDYHDYFKNGGIENKNLAQIHPQDVADYINQKNGASVNEPPTVPTQKAWIKTAEALNSMVARDPYGKPLPDSQAGVGGYRNSQLLQMARDLNSLNKKTFPGLTEAKAASGDTISGIEEKGRGFKLGASGEYAEDPKAFDRRFKTLSDTDKEATKNGYIQHLNQEIQANPIAASAKYQSPAHQQFQETMFGKDSAAKIKETLSNIRETSQQATKGGVVEQAHETADTALKSHDKAKFDEAYSKATPHEKEAIEAKYKEKLAKAINKIDTRGENVEEKHLNELKHLTTDEFEKHVQDAIFGKDKAAKLREAITKQIDLAKSGSQVSKFSTNKPAENHVNAFEMGGIGLVTKGPHGALKGIATSQALKGVKHVIKAVKQGRMTPEAQQALADKLAQSPAETAKDIRNLKARKESMPLHKSSLTEDLARHALKGVGYLAGRGTANALAGISTSDDGQ